MLHFCRQSSITLLSLTLWLAVAFVHPSSPQSHYQYCARGSNVDKKKTVGASTRNNMSKNGDRSGYDNLRDPLQNKGLALTDECRDLLHVRGLLPAGRVPIEVQMETALKQIRERPTPFDKFLYLDSIRDVNAQLFYALLVSHTDELLPIVYTPVVGQFCQSFSHVFQPR